MGLGKKLIMPQPSAAGYAVDDANLRIHLEASNSASYPGSGTTWQDLKGNANGTLVGGASFNTTGYMTIANTSQSISVAHDAYLRPNDNAQWSISVWMRTASTASGGVVLFSKGGPNDWEYDFWVYMSGSNRGVLFNLYQQGGGRTDTTRNRSSSNTWWNSNTWHNITVTLNESTDDAKLYVDGTQRASDTSWTNTSTDESTRPLLFGLRNDFQSSYRFTGDINNIRVYDKVLTPTEVSQISTAGYQG